MERSEANQQNWGECKECPVLNDLQEQADRLRNSGFDGVITQLGLKPEFNEHQAEDYENQITYIRQFCIGAMVARRETLSRDGTERIKAESVSCGSDALACHEGLGITDRAKITRTIEAAKPATETVELPDIDT